MSKIHRALIALVLVGGVAGQAGQVKADAISDQKKAFEKLGTMPNLEEHCTIFTKSDAERAHVLRERGRRGRHAVPENDVVIER